MAQALGQTGGPFDSSNPLLDSALDARRQRRHKWPAPAPPFPRLPDAGDPEHDAAEARFEMPVSEDGHEGAGAQRNGRQGG